MLKPVNGHLLIEPVEFKQFISSEKTIYEEVGLVVGIDDNLENQFGINNTKGLKVGDKVFFDSWLSAKYPDPKDNKKYLWLTKFEDIRAIETNDQISK